MKAIVIFLLLGISLSFSPGKSLDYAEHYCKNYNPSYNDYSSKGGDGANFVSQCLAAGGVNLDGCAGRDDKGMIPNISDLKNCLKLKGWKSKVPTKSEKYVLGYPMFFTDSGKEYAAIIDIYRSKEKIVYYHSHSPECCQDFIGTIRNSFVVIYYP